MLKLSFRAVSAQIGDLVVRLSDCIAEASQNNCRNPQYPEIPQPSWCAHVFSLICPSKVSLPR